MLNPEVVKFPAPESRLMFSQHMWSDSNAEEKWCRFVNGCHFNTQISLLLPDTPTLPEILLEALTVDTEYYFVHNLPIVELCKTHFIQAFLERGQVLAVSCMTLLDVEDSAALTADGKFYLNVDKFTYQKLGLNGKSSSHILRKPKNRFIIEIETLQKGFIPGKPNYEKVISRLETSRLKLSFWIKWEPNDEAICPSSIAKYFSDLGYEVEEKKVLLNSSLHNDVLIPRIEAVFPGTAEETMEIKSEISDIVQKVEPEEMIDWIGCQMIGIQLGTTITSISELINPQPSDLGGCLISISTGFFSSRQIQNLILTLRSWLEQRSTAVVPYVCLVVYGHPDSPITWGKSEHAFNTNGDNFYTMVIQRKFLWLYRTLISTRPKRLYVKSSNK